MVTIELAKIKHFIYQFVINVLFQKITLKKKSWDKREREIDFTFPKL